MQAGLFCLVALSLMVNVPALWRCYRLVRQGVAVYAPAQVSALVPKAVSVGVTLVLTGLVGLGSVFIVMGTLANFNTLIGWTVAGVILLPLWLLTGYFWYRVVRRERQIITVIPPEPSEGVWPPAPQRRRESDHES